MNFDFEELYNDVPVGCFTSNSSGLILNANKYFLDLLECKSEEVIGKKCFWDFLTVGGKIYFQTHYFPTLQLEGSKKEINFELQRKNKTRLPILINTKKSGSSKDLSLYNSVVFDISERKSFEKELIAERKKEEQLKEQLKETNKKIVIQADIIKKQNESLDRLNSVKDKFFSIIAHDIKGPLNQLNSFVYLINNQLDSFSKKDLKDLSAQIQLSLLDTIDLTNNLFSWAQAQIKGYGETKSILSVEEVVKEVIDSNRAIAQAKKLKLSYTLDGDPKIEVDKNQLQFIIRNLIANAIKFTPKGGSINVHCEQAGQNKMKMSITDNGVGMSQEVANSLFHDQVKASKVGTDGETGHGIGLLLVKEFVAMNNGTIEVTSKEGEGTTFLVTLGSV